MPPPCFSLFVSSGTKAVGVSFAFYRSVGGGVISCVRMWLESFESWGVHCAVVGGFFWPFWVCLVGTVMCGLWSGCSAEGFGVCLFLVSSG